jgi:hypothetical protein
MSEANSPTRPHGRLSIGLAVASGMILFAGPEWTGGYLVTQDDPR